MKNKTSNYLIILFLSFITLNLYGQESIKKGKYLIGGGIGFNISDRTEEQEDVSPREIDRFSFNFSPYFGKFIKDRVLLGVKLDIYTTKIDTDEQEGLYTSELRSKSFGGGIFLRKYFPIVDKFGVFFQPGVSYTRSSSESTQYSNQSDFTYENYEDSKSHTISVNSNLGLYYFISEKFSIETNLANIVLSKSFSETDQSSNYQDEITNTKVEANNLTLNFINELSFDQVFIINYFF